MSEVWRYQPHPEVWLLIVGIVVLAVYALRVVGPRAVRPGEVVLSRSQAAWFVAGTLTLWFASDWPVHDVGEEYLYSVHMWQHLLLSLVIPPMFLLATPTWLVRMVVGSGAGYRLLRFVTRPVQATILFNLVVVLSHWPAIVNNTVTSSWLHYGMHVLVVGSALIMWLPVCGPLPELRYSLGAQMPYLFVQSIIPTVPVGFLVFAENAVYKSYDITTRVWGMSVEDDQQLAGAIMKVVGGTYLWVIIGVLFIRFVSQSEDSDRARGVALDRRAPDDAVLTWAEVERELATAPPAPPDSTS
jgi:putative membrane protein